MEKLVRLKLFLFWIMQFIHAIAKDPKNPTRREIREAKDLTDAMVEAVTAED